MTFRKGRSGNPGGRPKQRKFREALSLALSETDQKTGLPKLRRIADNLVDAAMKGEHWAIKEVADRTDGKAVQAIDFIPDNEKPIEEFTSAELNAMIAGNLEEEGWVRVKADDAEPSQNKAIAVQNNDI